MPSRPINPEALGADIADQLNFLIDAAQQRPTFVLRAKIIEELCRHYRAVGICVLVAEGDADAFYHWLIQSALSRKFYLDGIRAEGGGEPRFVRASFVDPVLDAVASRQWRLASELADLNSHVWLEGEEYEDDFLYGEFWRQRLAGDKAALPGLVRRWIEVLEGGDDPRLDLVSTLLNDRAEGFTDTLRSLLDSVEAEARAAAEPKTDSAVTDDYAFHPNRWISVEGLAWLALAERESIAVEAEFPACPRVVRGADYTPFKPLAYPMIELGR